MTIRIVALEERHLSTMLTWLDDADLREHIGTIFPIPLARHLDWYRRLLDDRSQLVLAIEDDSRHIGTIGLRSIDLVYRNAELWLYIGEQTHRGSGAARAAVGQLLEFSFATLNLHRVFAQVFDFNERAKKFFCKCGMKPEGVLREAVFKRGQYWDKHVFAILSSETTQHENG